MAIKTIINFISVEDELPTFPSDTQYPPPPHHRTLILVTQKYGQFVGFYDGTVFRTSYAEILENVTHWAVMPKLHS